MQRLHSSLLTSRGVTLYVKREDLIHPIIGGNKWRKLKWNISSILADRNKPVLSFGGAFSNHIYALAGAGVLFDVKTIGIIRGEEGKQLNPTLGYAKSVGMHLHYVCRKDYRDKTSLAFLEMLRNRFGDFHLIPEGGSNSLALPGCADVITELDTQLQGAYDYVCLPCGTAGTLAGLISSNTKKKFLAIAVLKGAGFLHKNVDQLLGVRRGSNWEINLDYHFNGYAKRPTELMQFITTFQQAYNIPLEPVYSGKMFYGLFDLIAKKYFPQGTIIVALHTGGLQNETR